MKNQVMTNLPFHEKSSGGSGGRTLPFQLLENQAQPLGCR
jgi:hypothetical protein